MSGYERYRMNKFEPYDLYLEHRGFLRDDAVISFTDPRGRLMALKPDVTMSIVKNASADAAVERLFYIENVFRVPPGGSEFAEIAQMGLECLACNRTWTLRSWRSPAARSTCAAAGLVLR